MSTDGSHHLTAQAATENALLYAYPLLAFQTRYNSLTPLIGVNKLGHARQLSTAQARATVKPNADTVYSTALYDVSQHDLYIDIPEVPEDQYALFSFHDPYGNNFAIIGQGDLAGAGSFYLTHGAVTSTPDESHRARIASPTTFGTFLIRWLFKGDNLSIIHSFQNSTAARPVSRQPEVQLDNGRDYPPLTSMDWSHDPNRSPAHNALHLLCQVGAVNTPGRLAGASVQEVLQKSDYCASGPALPEVNIDAADRKVLAELKSAGQASLEKRNNGWSVMNSALAGNFGEDYGLRAQIAFTGYLMLTSPAALYPSWSVDSTGPPLEGDMLELGPGESYIYTFSSKPPLGKLGFWSLTVYDSKGYLIDNPRNVSSLGDRSNITYPSGATVYGPASSPEHDGPFQILVQPADIIPSAKWTSNWLPAPSGGGKFSALLRLYNATEDLLDGRYQFPIVSKQQCIEGTDERAGL